jgi:hypothetical protein
MRDPTTLAEVSTLLERVAAPFGPKVRQPARQPAQHRAKARGAKRRDTVRSALRERYDTMDALDSLLETLGMPKRRFRTIDEAHRAILERLEKTPDAARIETDIINSARRVGGELDRLTNAIVSRRRE